jgi:hypothetical protein
MTRPDDTEPSTPEQHAEIVVRNVRDHELFNVVRNKFVGTASV